MKSLLLTSALIVFPFTAFAEPGESVVDIHQQGSLNAGIIEQVGTHILVANQAGNGNILESNQTGVDNILYSSQGVIDYQGNVTAYGNRNRTTVTQYGENNHANVNAIGTIGENAADNVVNLNMAGANNSSSIDIRDVPAQGLQANRNHVSVTTDTQFSNTSLAIKGSDNIATQSTIGYENTVYAVVNGNGNQMTQRQNGGVNSVEVYQGSQFPFAYSDNNTATVEQIGDNHTAYLTQNGEANLAEIIQSGVGNNAQVGQNGLLNEARVLQTEGGNNAQISQLGNRHVANVTQHGSYNEVYIDQR
jgi:hypothetical protein